MQNFLSLITISSLTSWENSLFAIKRHLLLFNIVGRVGRVLRVGKRMSSTQ